MDKNSFFGRFYGGNPRVPGARKGAPMDMNKDFFTAEQPGTRTLAKSGGIEVDAIGVLDYHMRKASENERDKKRRGLGGGLK